jgi:hypothetical protein
MATLRGHNTRRGPHQVASPGVSRKRGGVHVGPARSGRDGHDGGAGPPRTLPVVAPEEVAAVVVDAVRRPRFEVRVPRSQASSEKLAAVLPPDARRCCTRRACTELRVTPTAMLAARTTVRLRSQLEKWGSALSASSACEPYARACATEVSGIRSSWPTVTPTAQVGKRLHAVLAGIFGSFVASDDFRRGLRSKGLASGHIHGPTRGEPMSRRHRCRT